MAKVADSCLIGGKMPSSLRVLQRTSNTGFNPYAYVNNLTTYVKDPYEYSIPEVRKSIIGTRAQYKAVIDASRQAYANPDTDPMDLENRLMLASVISNIMPGTSIEDAYKYADEYMYRATGYKTDVNGYVEHLENTFKSAGLSILASFRTAALLTEGRFRGFDDAWQEKKLDALKEISNYATGYRTDNRYNDNIFENALTAAASIAPSMLPAIGISGIAALVSYLTGGTAVPGAIAALKSLKTMSTLDKMINLGAIGARFGTSAAMEGGGTMLELLNAGVSDELAFNTGLAVGLANSSLETFIDTDIELASRPLRGIFNALGRKRAGRIFKESLEDALSNIPREVLKSVTGETPTEIAQEMISMLGYNFAINTEKETNKSLKDATGYTDKDFADAFWETLKQTALGTGLISAGGGLISLGGRFAGSRFAESIKNNKYTSSDGAEGLLRTSDIDYRSLGRTLSEDQIKNFQKTSPINVVRVGNRYRAVNMTPEQEYALANSSNVYVQNYEMSTESAIRRRIDFDTVDMHSPVKRSVVESVINSGMSNGKIAGFTYYNENLARVADPSKAAYISLVESRDSDPIMIPLSEESNVSAVQLQKDIYGETIDKVSTALEPEENSGTSSETASAEESEATEPEYKTIVDGEEEADTFTDEELSEAESAIDELESAEEPAETISTGSSEDAESETAIQENTESDETVVPESEAIVQENTSEGETALPETESIATEIAMQENAPETQAETTEEAPAQIAGDDTVQDTRTPEEIRADEDTARRNERNQARINAQNKWDQVQRMLTGTDSAKDVDVLTVYFSSILGQTRLGESAQAVEASARAAAEIAVGFARASGLKGKDYYNTINAFMSEDFIPETADGTVFGDKLGWFLKDSGERYINIMRNADPSTLIHELGHHFLSVLTPDMPAYNLIHEVYAKAIERDGGIIGKDTNEAFARDLEKYVYFRKSSNSRLNAIFQKLYDVAKALWQTLKGDERLSSQKVKMFDAIFAEEQTPEAVSAEVAKSADKAMSSDSDTKMSDMAAELVSETAESAEETPETVNAQAEYVIDSIDNEAAEVLRDISVDYVPDAEPEPIPEGADTIDVPQTEEEIAAGEPVQREIIEEPAEDESLGYVMDMDVKNDIAPDSEAFYKERMDKGVIDAKKIEKQINKKNNQKYFDEISARYDVDSPIVGMASTVNIYKAISGITGVPDLDTDFAEFFYAKDGGIYVLLKKDIRRDAEDEVTLFLQDKPEPKFWKIPFSDNDISVESITFEYYIDKIPEIVEREYTEDADGNIMYREEAEAEPTTDEDIADQDKYDITEEDSDDEVPYKTETRVKNTFTGYSDPFVTAVTFARSYEIKPELYFSSNNTEAVREAADLIEGSLSSTTLANSYRRFTKYIEEVKKKAEKEKKRGPELLEHALNRPVPQVFVGTDAQRPEKVVDVFEVRGERPGVARLRFFGIHRKKRQRDSVRDGGRRVRDDRHGPARICVGRVAAPEALFAGAGAAVDEAKLPLKLGMTRGNPLDHAGAQEPHVGASFKHGAHHFQGAVVRKERLVKEGVGIVSGLRDLAEIDLIGHEVEQMGRDGRLAFERRDVGQILSVRTHEDRARGDLVRVGKVGGDEGRDVAHALLEHRHVKARTSHEEFDLPPFDRAREFRRRVVMRFDAQFRDFLLQILHHRPLHVVAAAQVRSFRLEVEKPDAHRRGLGGVRRAEHEAEGEKKRRGERSADEVGGDEGHGVRGIRDAIDYARLLLR